MGAPTRKQTPETGFATRNSALSSHRGINGASPSAPAPSGRLYVGRNALPAALWHQTPLPGGQPPRSSRRPRRGLLPGPLCGVQAVPPRRVSAARSAVPRGAVPSDGRAGASSNRKSPPLLPNRPPWREETPTEGNQPAQCLPLPSPKAQLLIVRCLCFPQVISSVLDECGCNIDAAIKRLGELQLAKESTEQEAGAASATPTPPQQGKRRGGGECSLDSSQRLGYVEGSAPPDTHVPRLQPQGRRRRSLLKLRGPRSGAGRTGWTWSWPR